MKRRFVTLMAVLLCAAFILCACGETQIPSNASSGDNADDLGVTTPTPAAATPEPTPSPTPEPELTLEAILQAARDAGYEVMSNEQVFENYFVLNSPFSDVKDGFLVHIVLGNKSGTLLEDDYRIFECETEAGAQANAALKPYMFFEGKYILNGKFFAEYLKKDDSNEAVLAKLAECLERILKCDPIPVQELITLDIEQGEARTQTAADGMVTLRIPASLFTTTTEEKVMADAAAMGVKVTKNADGSYTYIMTIEQQQATLNDFRQQLLEAMELIPAHDTYKDAIKGFEHNDDFSEIKIIAYSKKLEENLRASMAVGIVCLLAPNYQAFSGNENPVTKIEFIDADSGAVYQTANSPEDFASDSNFVQQ